jgi:hypothetical protein
MRLRTSLTIGAAALAAGLLALTSTAVASNPTGTSINFVRVNGNTAGTHTITGVFKSGTASFGGGTFGCTGGTVQGSAAAGATPATKIATVSFSTLNITCATPLGVNATISIGSNCASAAFQDSNVHDGLVDTGTGTKFSNVNGTVTLAANCGTVTAGPCTANVSGTVSASYNEAIKAGNYQDLILNGTGFTLSNQSALCFGLLTGGVTLNNIDFNINSPSSTVGALDFRTTA